MAVQLSEEAVSQEYGISQADGRVLLIGGYGAGNIGDEAILSGLLKHVSESAGQLIVTSHDAEETERIHAAGSPIQFKAIEPTPVEIIRQIQRADTIVVGGGGIFSRYMGPYAKKIPYATLFANIQRKDVIWTAIGVYPSTPMFTSYLLRLSMRRSQSVDVRDPISRSTLRNMGVESRLVPDPATTLESDAADGISLLEDQGVRTNRPLLGIAARHVENDTYDSNLRRAYESVAEEYSGRGWEIVFLPFCRHPTETVEQDGRLCESLSTLSNSYHVLNYETPKEMVNIVSALSGLVATRLHSMIFAKTTGTPFVAVEYADKVSSLLSHYGMADRGIDLEDVNAETLLSVLDRVNMNE